MDNKIAIVITAYNRPEALTNLLNSLKDIRCNRDVTLVISIDNNGTDEVNKIASDFEWKYGNKIVTIHKEKKGLKNHFIWVGDQTEEYENVIFLEDDLLVSPEIINFVDVTINFYKNDGDVAGICLYNPILCEFNGCKYYQTQDGNDVYFLQHPYWGNIWIKEKWNDFKKWFETYEPNNYIIPQAVANWKDSSFKKVYIQYLVETNKYFVVPRVSLLTNTGVAGLHNTASNYQYQNVLLNEKLEYRLCKCNDSKSVYDAYMELLPDIVKNYNSDLVNYDFEVDLKGNRHSFTKEYVLTTRKTENAIIEFTSLMKPMENGVIFNVHGEGISLSKASDILTNDGNYDAKRLYKDIDMNYMVGVRAVFHMLKISLLKKFWRIFR